MQELGKGENVAGIKLSPSEAGLFEAIREHVYPEPEEGRSLPIDPGEMPAAKRLQRKGLVTRLPGIGLQWFRGSTRAVAHEPSAGVA